jgi:hypothetical protein
MSGEKENHQSSEFPLLKERRMKDVKEDSNLVANGRFHYLVAFERFHCLVALGRFHRLVALEKFHYLVTDGRFHVWWPREGEKRNTFSPLLTFPLTNFT